MRSSALLAILLIPATALLLWPVRAQDTRRLPIVPPASRGPSALVFSPDGAVLYVAEQDAGQVDVIDPDSGKTLAAIPSGGQQPTGLAISSDGKTLIAANSYSGNIGVIDTDSRKLRTTVAIPGMPWDVGIAGGQAFVSVSQLDEVAVVDIAAAKVTDRIKVGQKPIRSLGILWQATDVPLGHRPHGLAITLDRRTLLCVSTDGAALTIIDVDTRKELGCVRMPAINLRGIFITTDGKHALVSGQKPDENFSTENPATMWANELIIVKLDGEKSFVESLLKLDKPGAGAAEPNGIVLDSAGNAIVALSGVHEIAVIPDLLMQAGMTDHPKMRRIAAGANPRAVALRPGGKAEVWTANHLGNSLAVLNQSADAVSRTVDLPEPPVSDPRMQGRFLFASGHLTPAGNFTCNTCHPDGNTEGLSWRFHFLPKGIERRNSRNLRGGLLLTGPFGWEQREEDYEKFVNDELEKLLRVHRMPHSELHAFWDLVNNFDMPPNPYRNSDGSMTAAALRGKTIFQGAGGCIACHSGSKFGGNGKKEWVGTMPAGQKLDVPHLYGAYDSAPYLHDGRAATLEDVFLKCNPQGQHGKAASLTREQLADVLEYVREL